MFVCIFVCMYVCMYVCMFTNVVISVGIASVVSHTFLFYLLMCSSPIYVCECDIYIEIFLYVYVSVLVGGYNRYTDDTCR